MSERIPESIPTSADPRSKRPVKKRALSPRSERAAQVEALFEKPDQEIRIPLSSNAVARPGSTRTPPEIVTNVQGSSAGAGSGEFHVYKASRRREYERLKAMDEEVKGEEEAEKWERERREREDRDREKTRKNREKRERLKAKKSGKGGPVVAAGAPAKSKWALQGQGKSPRQADELGQDAPQVEVEAEVTGLIIHDDD